MDLNIALCQEDAPLHLKLTYRGKQITRPMVWHEGEWAVPDTLEAIRALGIEPKPATRLLGEHDHGLYETVLHQAYAGLYESTGTTPMPGYAPWDEGGCDEEDVPEEHLIRWEICR